VKDKNTIASMKKCKVKIKGKLEEVLKINYSKSTMFASMTKYLCINEMLNKSGATG
jgi:hypothetical protein